MTAMDVLVDSVRLSELVEAVLLAAGFRDADAALWPKCWSRRICGGSILMA
ncbi:MAG: hypothetical protein CM1200mP2_30950 [Planctomycetaceae bacterium]|nr:MAG: hypothetical protein CM1200mP2_30950 [Planctomycetaceae bacterium]